MYNLVRWYMKKFLAGLLLFFIGIVNWNAISRHAYFSEAPGLFTPKDTTPVFTLYMTIDDGPLEGVPYIDSVFREEKVPADLFLVGAHVYQDSLFMDYLNELKKNKWFEFNNHSFTHANEDYDSYYAHPKTVLYDMRRNNDSLHFSNTICRMPARNMWRIGGKMSNDGYSGNRAANLLKRKGYHVIGWDLQWETDSLDLPIQSPDSLFQQLKQAFAIPASFVPGHVVLLCHDGMFINLDAKNKLQAFIRLVKAAGNIRFSWLKYYPLYRK